MIIKKHIHQTLIDLNIRYDQSSRLQNSKELIYFSKLAILEYCGWIEEAFDLIVRRAVKGKLKQTQLANIIEDKIKKNSGFQYETHLRQMLITAIGVIGMEKLERKLDLNGSIQVLISELNALKADRNSAAHTWINGAMRSYPAPSILISRLNKVHPIIKDIYSEIVKL